MAMVCSAALALPAAAHAETFERGAKVMASPLMMEPVWSACIVVSGPGANDYYQLNCAANPARDQRIVVVPSKWIRPGGAAAAAAKPAAGAFAANSIVLASPTQMDGFFMRCVVVGGPHENDYYNLDCADEHAGVDDRMIKVVKRFAVPGKWIKANNPAYRPDMQVAAIRAAQAAVAPAKPAAARAASKIAGLRTGEYACYGVGGKVLIGLGFKVLPSSAYTDLDGKNRGSFSVAGGVVSFHGGHLGGQQGHDLYNGNFRIGAQASCEPF